jgi:hypothetical protein
MLLPNVARYFPPLDRLSSTFAWALGCWSTSKSEYTSPCPKSIFKFALNDAGNVSSILPFNELNDIGFDGSTRSNTAVSRPFNACATADPDKVRQRPER